MTFSPQTFELTCLISIFISRREKTYSKKTPRPYEKNHHFISINNQRIRASDFSGTDVKIFTAGRRTRKFAQRSLLMVKKMSARHAIKTSARMPCCRLPSYIQLRGSKVRPRARKAGYPGGQILFWQVSFWPWFPFGEPIFGVIKNLELNFCACVAVSYLGKVFDLIFSLRNNARWQISSLKKTNT